MNDVRARELKGFEARLLPVLLEAVDERARVTPRRRRRVRRRAVVRAGALAVAALVGAVMAANTLAVGTDAIQVSAADAVRDAAAVEQELRAQGVDARILVVPAPDLAGTWVHIFFAPGAKVSSEDWSRLTAQAGSCCAADLRPDILDEILDRGRNVYHRTVMEIPRDVHGPMTLVAGREPHPGDGSPWWLDGETGPSGAFWCMGLESMDPADAGRALTDLGYRVRYHYNPWPSAPVGVDPGDRWVDTPPPGSAVYDAGFLTPTEVEVGLVPADQVNQARAGWGLPPVGATPPAWAPECPS